jgi:hypothetical protein
VWAEVAPELTPADFRHPERMDAAFLRRLSGARRRAGVPFRVRSDHRPPEANLRAGGAPNSAHRDVPCRAVDLWVHDNEERFHVLEALLAAGFRRIGVYPAREDGSGSLHVDASEANPAPRIWTRH